ncbi:MAG: phage holin family protein [Christensenellaceae bacterium]|nr:phage holin family protein [Christensenellaceae bacterium]
MFSIVIRFLACVISIPLCAHYLPGVHMYDMYYAAMGGAGLGIIHLLLRPILKALLAVFNFFTLGLISIFLDTWLILLAIRLVPGSFSVDSFWWAAAISVVINILNELLGFIFKKRR